MMILSQYPFLPPPIPAPPPLEFSVPIAFTFALPVMVTLPPIPPGAVPMPAAPLPEVAVTSAFP